MKVIFIITFIIAVIMSASIGCLIIFKVFSFDQGVDYIFKSLTAIILLGVSSALIALVTGKKGTPSE
jgi:branched-subunit amino acid ABC-type transport system permease component